MLPSCASRRGLRPPGRRERRSRRDAGDGMPGCGNPGGLIAAATSAEAARTTASPHAADPKPPGAVSPSRRRTAGLRAGGVEGRGRL
eukprot:5584925-Alexandrium_andersonii.AAC.1